MKVDWHVCRLLLAILAVFLTGIFSASKAQRINWSFTENPQPAFTELMDDERAAIEAAEGANAEAEPGKYCVEIPRAYFEIYNDRYPAFAEHGTEPTRYMAWKAHVVAQGMPSPSTCIVGEASIRLMRSMAWPAHIELLFCGNYSRTPQNSEEEYFHDALNELVEYAKFGSTDAISSLLVANADAPPIILNADVEYFLRKALQQSGEHESQWDADHLAPSLNKERIELLDKALETHDLALVLHTTQPCAE